MEFSTLTLQYERHLHDHQYRETLALLRESISSTHTSTQLARANLQTAYEYLRTAESMLDAMDETFPAE